MTSKEAKQLLEMVEKIKIYLHYERMGSENHKRAWKKTFDLEKKLRAYRNAFYGSGNPSYEEVAIPLNEFELYVLIELVSDSGVLDNDK